MTVGIKGIEKSVKEAFEDEIADDMYMHFIDRMNQTLQLFDDRLVKRFFCLKVLLQLNASIVLSIAAKGKEHNLLEHLMEMTKKAMKIAKK